MTAAADLFVEFWLGYLGFSREEEYIGERAKPGGGQGGHTTPRRGQGAPAPGGGVAPPWLPFGSPSDSVFVTVKYDFGFNFVQFREYFLCNFSETKNS